MAAMFVNGSGQNEHSLERIVVQQERLTPCVCTVGVCSSDLCILCDMHNL
jgi:hypothetical protein